MGPNNNEPKPEGGWPPHPGDGHKLVPEKKKPNIVLASGTVTGKEGMGRRVSQTTPSRGKGRVWETQMGAENSIPAG